MKSIIKNKHGDIMMSVLVSSFILSSIVMILMMGMGHVTAQESHQKLKLMAAETAESFFEELNLWDSSDSRLQSGTHTLLDSEYTLNWTVAVDTPVPGIKRVDLEVEWAELNMNKRVLLTTYRK